MKTKKRRSKRDNNVGRPTRPLNAYNIFFALERRKIVAKQQKEAALNGYTCPSSQRKHEQAHVGFANLARIVSERWKAIDERYKAELEEKARLDKIRYDNEMKEWISKNQPDKPDFSDLNTFVTTINPSPTTSSDTHNDVSLVSLRRSNNILSDAHESRSSLTNSDERHASKSLGSSSGTLPFQLYCAPCLIPVSIILPEHEFSICPGFLDEQRSIHAKTCEFDTAATSRDFIHTRPLPPNNGPGNESNPTSNSPSLRSGNSAGFGCFAFEPLPHKHFPAPRLDPDQSRSNAARQNLPRNQHDLTATSLGNSIEFSSNANLGHCTPLDLRRDPNETASWRMKSDRKAGLFISADDGHHVLGASWDAPVFGHTCEFGDGSSSWNPSGNQARVPAKPFSDQDERNGRYTPATLQAPSPCDLFLENFDLEPLPYQHFNASPSAAAHAKATLDLQKLLEPKEHDLDATLFHNHNGYPSHANLGQGGPRDLPPAQDKTKTISWGMNSDKATGLSTYSGDEYYLYDAQCGTQRLATSYRNSNMFTDEYRCAWSSTDNFPTIPCGDDKFTPSPARFKSLELCKNDIPGSVEMQSFRYNNSWNCGRSSAPTAMAALASAPEVRTGMISTHDHNTSDSNTYSIQEIETFFSAIR
ncbi:hypothetical protein HJC23_002959 [Cyclotella cryptica]|uniref:HMG box domain-containing protein n=1 Tax=Cyclotella cryptica TaxID=29204 RepID=A0ABD3PEU4_9STRA|eukprot:CCRYP_015244-RA/>CCRYP_015244-RA protein AED:0.06 eAED:0.06 QI:0/-1/0/1/-1/1/1/0/644